MVTMSIDSYFDMTRREKMFYFLNWELISPIDHLIDATQGNEVVEVFIHDIDGCRPTARYTIPIVESGQSFASLTLSLLYEKDKCSKPFKNLFVYIRILRGIEQRVIYTNDFILLAPYYTDPTIRHIPIYRIWYCQDYYKMLVLRMFSLL